MMIDRYYNIDFVEYLSHVFRGEDSESPFQYETVHEKPYYEDNRKALNEELKDHFNTWLYISQVKKSQRLAFLDFHMEVYEGDPIDFWDFVFNCPRYLAPDSDDYMNVLILSSPDTSARVEWMDLRKEHAYRGQREFGGFDNRISGRLSNRDVRQYFMDAFLPEKGTKIMTEEDVLHFIHANFAGFKPRKEPKLLKTHTTQINVTRIIRRFYLEHYVKSSEAQVYCEMMKENFQTYENTSLKSLSSNFSKCIK